MNNSNLKNFIENYEKRNDKVVRIKFSVNYSYSYRDYNTDSSFSTINLDEEDLKILYDKYYPKYLVALGEEVKNNKTTIEKEIRDLEEKLLKYKNKLIN
jgi:stress response protein YsnF